MKLVSRMKKIQEDLLTLKEQCHELLAAKQVLSSFNTLEEEIRICIIWDCTNSHPGFGKMRSH